MPHPLRHDQPGSWHHVYIRGIARRTVFETRRDIRVLLFLLALEVRRGTLEIHSFAFLTSHGHLLLCSLRGELSQALQRVLAAYVRWFNRSRRRDGSLFRGRFGSRPVTSVMDRLNVIAYIDANAVQANLAPTPQGYEHGSARFWAGARVPPWLATEFVASILRVTGPRGPGATEAYRRFFGPRAGSPLAHLMERRLARWRAETDPLDDLVAAAPPGVLAWMLRKAALADQTRPGIPVVDPPSADAQWKAARGRFAGDASGRRGPRRPLERVARVALLRDLAGLTYAQIAARCRIEAREARTCYRLHAERLGSDARYAEACGAAARAALAGLHGRRRVRAAGN